jgi:REP element-mobilizing transposase RayT
MSRGNEKKKIYLDDADRAKFLAVLDKALRRYNVICHAYVLMDNHYHLVLETPDPNLSQAMQFLNGTYSQAFNRRHGRVGHLLQGRFKEVLVEKQSHLLVLSRYVVLNPVRAAIVDLPHDWRWSSFRATARLDPPPDFLCIDWIPRCFGAADPKRARKQYVEFVLQGIGRTDRLTERLRREPVIGSEEFVSRFQAGVEQASSSIREVPKRSRLAGRPGLAAILDGIESPSARDQRMLQAHEQHGYTISEIARHLGVHRTTASRAIRRAGMREFTV